MESAALIIRLSYRGCNRVQDPHPRHARVIILSLFVPITPSDPCNIPIVLMSDVFKHLLRIHVESVATFSHGEDPSYASECDDTSQSLDTLPHGYHLRC